MFQAQFSRLGCSYKHSRHCPFCERTPLRGEKGDDQINDQELPDSDRDTRASRRR